MSVSNDKTDYEMVMEIVKREIDCALGTPSHGRLIKVRRLIKKYHADNAALKKIIALYKEADSIHWGRPLPKDEIELVWGAKLDIQASGEWTSVIRTKDKIYIDGD